MTIEAMLPEAIQHHQAGGLAEAERLYRQILEQEPNHARVLQLLGVLHHQQGRSDLAVDLIGQALTLAPDWPQARSNRGEALRVLGRLDEAIAEHCQAVALNPGRQKRCQEPIIIYPAADAIVGKLSDQIDAHLKQ